MVTATGSLDERARLLEAHYAGALPLDLLESEQQRLASELNYVEERLSTLELKFDIVERNLEGALEFVGNLQTACVEANQRHRRPKRRHPPPRQRQATRPLGALWF